MSDADRGASGIGTAWASEVDAVVVGAGFAGLYMLHRLRELGLSALVLERGGGVGGTWFWNRYPGARCDVESLDYSYSFSAELEQEWVWTERYASQPELLRYLNHVADRFDLRRDIRLNVRVTEARYDEDGNRWALCTADGGRVMARFCVMATGCLSAAHRPDLPGLATFAGRCYHTAAWPPEGVDFTGRRVGVVGTGSSGIQAIPLIARRAAHLYVFQRTPNFSVPARNGPLDPDALRRVKATYAERRRRLRRSRVGLPFDPPTRGALEVDPQERQRVYEAGWQEGGFAFLSPFSDLRASLAANDTAAKFVRAKIRATVRDPAVAEALSPRSYPIGTKRLCVDTDYYETFNRANVTLIDLRRAPIEAITPREVRTRDAAYAVDALVFATGFDAMTGALLAIDITGRGGRTLRAAWARGPRAYLGLAVAGFPNLFLVTGPGSPSVLSNMAVSIEQHVEWIADCIGYLDRHGLDRVEATAAAQARWLRHADEVARTTLFPDADTWYAGANIAGKPRVFMPYLGGVGAYRQTCDEVAANGYAGFRLAARQRRSRASTPTGLPRPA